MEHTLSSAKCCSIDTRSAQQTIPRSLQNRQEPSHDLSGSANISPPSSRPRNDLGRTDATGRCLPACCTAENKRAADRSLREARSFGSRGCAPECAFTAHRARNEDAQLQAQSRAAAACQSGVSSVAAAKANAACRKYLVLFSKAHALLRMKALENCAG